MNNNIIPIIQDEGRYDELIVKGKDDEENFYWAIEKDNFKGRRYSEFNSKTGKILSLKFY